MAMLKPNPLPLLLLLLLFFFSHSTAAPHHSSPPQCETSLDDDIGHDITPSFSGDPTTENDLSFPEAGGLGPDPSSSSTGFPDETGPLSDNPDENFMFPPSSSPSPSPTLTTPPLPSLTDDLYTICSRTDYPDLCVDTALSNATGPINGPLEVLRFEMFALANATRAAFHKSYGLYMSQDGKRPVDEAAAMMKPYSTGPAASLEVCNSGYEQALHELEDAHQALVDSDRGKLGSTISALFPAYSGCGDEFSERGQEPMMVKEQTELMNLASICMAIVAHYFHA